MAQMIFVDGPEHGTSRPIEGTPSNEIYIPGYMLFGSRKSAETQLNSYETMPIHRYYLMGKTINNTYVYEYGGM